jgi:hypothetical protein
LWVMSSAKGALRGYCARGSEGNVVVLNSYCTVDGDLKTGRASIQS